MPQDKATDDLHRARLLCSFLNSNVVVEGVHRDCPLSLSSNESDQSPKLPKSPTLRVFVQSPEEKMTLLRRKGLLKSASVDWMKSVYLRPSLPFEERIRRDQLYRIASRRNAQAPKSNSKCFFERLFELLF